MGLLFAAGCIGMLFTPVFHVAEIQLEGPERILPEEILAAAGFAVGENIFSFSLKEAGEALSKIPYVNSVRIERQLPSRLAIKITESIPMAYVPCMDFHLVIDKGGKALEPQTGDLLYSIPVLLDFPITEFDPGEKILIQEEEKFQKTLEILRDLYNNNFIEEIQSITTKEENIILTLSEQLQIHMGDTEQFNSKIVMVQEVLKRLPENTSGIIDAKNPNKVYTSSE